MAGLVLYHRRGCHLCEQMLAAIYGTYGDEVEVELVDVDTDPALKERYGLRIPVLVTGQKVICEARLDEDALDAYFASAGGMGS